MCRDLGRLPRALSSFLLKPPVSSLLRAGDWGRGRAVCPAVAAEPRGRQEGAPRLQPGGAVPGGGRLCPQHCGPHSRSLSAE